MNGQDNPRQPITTYPRQEKPPPHIWTTWRRLLRTTYCMHRERKLDRPMRQWYQGRLNQTWDTVLDPATSLLYVWTSRKVHIYEPQGRRCKKFRFLRPHNTASFPLGCIPTSFNHQAGYLITSGYAKLATPPSHTPAQHAELLLMNRGIQTNIPRPIIAQAIWDGLAIMGTDGSVKDDTATYSWISTTNEDCLFTV